MKKNYTHIRPLITLMVCIFFVEMLIMFFLYYLIPPLPAAINILADSLLLIILLYPLLHFFILKPVLQENARSIVIQEELQRTNEKLRLAMNDVQKKEQILFDNTEKCTQTNRDLLAAKKKVEETLIECKANQHLLSSEKDRLDTIINQMSEGVLVIDKNRKLVLINTRAKEMLGYAQDQDMPAGYKKFFILHLWKELNEKGKDVVIKEITLQRPREIILQVSLASIYRQAEQKGDFVAVLRDVTVEKRVDKMRSDFVANVSHELRSPMAPMKDALGLVLDGTTGPLTEQQRRFLTLLDNNINRLLRLVNDLLDLSKIESGKMELRKETTNLAQLLKEVTAPLQVFAGNKKIELGIDISEDMPEVICDKDRISQVIINLITNAVKFTSEGGNVKVTTDIISTEAKDDQPAKDYIQISVTDTGPGMTSEEIATLFDRFKQLATPQSTKGTGLGLAISKAIVELHSGYIKVDSTPGEGSTFSFAIPLN